MPVVLCVSVCVCLCVCVCVCVSVGVEEYDIRNVHPGIVSDKLTMQTYSFLLLVVLCE